MKNFLSKYWKRILISIASIFIVINIISKCMAPHILVEEYAKYGPEVESKVETNASEVLDSVTESSPFTGDMLKVVLIAGGALILACVLSDLATKKSSGGKKK